MKSRLRSLPMLATMLVFVQYILQEDVHEDMLCAILLPTNTTAVEPWKSLNDYLSRILNWSFLYQYMHRWSSCHDWTVFWFHYLGQKDSLLNVSLCTVSSIEKCWLPEKCHLNVTMFCRMWFKLSTTLKSMPLTHICSYSSVRWTQSTHVSSYTQRWDGFLKVDHWPEFFELWEPLQRFLLE